MRMAFNLSLSQRLNQRLSALWGPGLLCWHISVQRGENTTPRTLLRRFFLLKLLSVLLFPHGARLPLLVGCVFSIQALLLLRSPHISHKPSTVLIGQLAIADTLMLLHFLLWLGESLGPWSEEVGAVMRRSVCWWEALGELRQGLLDAHYLASLLFLGLLGAEAVLVSRWPLETRRLRTSHSAQVTCSLLWLLVLLELLLPLASKLLLPLESLDTPGALPTSQTDSVRLAHTLFLPMYSVDLRRALWMTNSCLHYFALYRKPQKKSCFH